MGQIGFQEPLRLRADVVATVLEDGALLLDLDTKYFYLLNRSGWAITQLFESGTSLEHARSVAARAAAGGDVASEIDCFVGSLVAEDLLETVGSRRGPRFRAQRGMVHPDARETGRAAAASDRQRIRPDDSACGVSAVEAAAFGCGPLEVDVSGGPPALVDKVVEALSLFDHVWPSQPRMVRIRVESAPFVAPVDATYLSCARMVVGAPGDDLLEATTLTGAAASGRLAAARDDWTITAPPEAVADGTLEDVEDLVGLALTTGWRRAGWVPLHAAGIVDAAGNCVLVCAPSGGGKSTMTAAFVRRGWRTLGDDKLLARLDADGSVRVAALLHTFNLHPSTRTWFPEVGDLERLPTYSAWTEKRKVAVSSIWDAATADVGVPNRVVALSRSATRGASSAGVVSTPLSQPAVLATLLRQTVIPSIPTVAASIVEVGRGVFPAGVGPGDRGRRRCVRAPGDARPARAAPDVMSRAEGARPCRRARAAS